MRVFMVVYFQIEKQKTTEKNDVEDATDAIKPNIGKTTDADSKGMCVRALR